MKHITIKIVLTVWLSAFLLLLVCETILTVTVPRHFKNEAISSLENELLYAKALNAYILGESNEFPEAADSTMSGEIQFLPLDKPVENGVQSNTSAQTGFSFTPKTDAARERREVIDYVKNRPTETDSVEIFKTKTGKYVYAVYSEYFRDEGYVPYVMYINLNRILNYTKSINYVLIFFYVAVSAAMSIPGYILARQIENSQETQRRFFQNTSHELKTPLMTVQGYAEGIQTGITEPKEAADVILQESDRMTQLVNELLSLSKIDLHSLKPNLVKTDLREVLYDSLRAAEPLTESRRIKLTPVLPDEPVYINGDEDMLERVFSNVLSNGIRHCKSEVKITCTPYSRFVMVKFHDDGGGIKEEDMPHIFDRFYTGANGCTGIGLALAQELVKLHGGSISAYNDDGAVFAIKFFYR